MSIVDSASRTNTSLLRICTLTNVDSSMSLDICPVVTSVCIFNSLDSMITSGWVDVHDQGNAIEQYKFHGKEIIDIELNLNNPGGGTASDASDDFNRYSRRFFVYAIDSITAIRDKMTYRIKFIDPFALLNTDNRISWHFKQVKGEDIIKKIASLCSTSINMPYKTIMERQFTQKRLSSSQKLFDFNADVSTLHELDMYVPMMKPFELIRWIADRVVSSENSGGNWSDCLFFQTKDGKFHLSSFKRLFDRSPLVFTQQLATSATAEKQHMIESYTFNKIYDIQEDKLNGIYGLQFAIADFKPTTSKVTQSTVLGTTIASNAGEGGPKTNALSLHDTVVSYFNKGKSEKLGLIEPFQCASQRLTSTQTAGPNGQAVQVNYDTQTGSLIFLDACGIIHEDDKTYDEYKRVALPYVTGCIMKKVLSTYVVNLAMNGAFDIDVGRSFTIKLDSSGKGVTKQMSAFVNDVRWLVSDVKHEWRADTMQVKTYVTGFAPFLNRGETVVEATRR